MPTGLPNIYGSIEPGNFIFWDQTTRRSCMMYNSPKIHIFVYDTGSYTRFTDKVFA